MSGTRDADMDRDPKNTAEEERFYSNFRHAPMEEIRRLTQTTLDARAREKTNSLHAAMERRRERDLPITRVLKEKLGADSWPPVPALTKQLPSDKQRERLFKLGENAPKSRIIRLGSAHVLDVAPFDYKSVSFAVTGSGEADQWSDSPPPADNELRINANAGGGSSGTVTALSYLGQFFYVPTPPCGNTNGTLTVTVPFSYWGDGGDSKRFSFASVSVSFGIDIMQFNQDHTLSTSTGSSQTIWSDTGWALDQNNVSPAADWNSATLIVTMPVSSQFYYVCEAWAQVGLQSDGELPNENAWGATDVTVAYIAYDLWP